MSFEAVYRATAEALVERVYQALKANPEFAGIESPWDLFKVPGFNCSDLEPSLAQASAALVLAKQRLHREDAA